jgi:hypothetical protein
MATEVVVEEVANNLEEASRVVRHLNPRALGYGVGGICIGLGIGFMLGQRWRKEQSRKEAFQESEKEIEELREHFFARRAEKVEPTLKPDLDEVVQERGYSTMEVETEEGFPAPRKRQRISTIIGTIRMSFLSETGEHHISSTRMNSLPTKMTIHKLRTHIMKAIIFWPIRMNRSWRIQKATWDRKLCTASAMVRTISILCTSEIRNWDWTSK